MCCFILLWSISMERYNNCSSAQKEILNRLYEYLGFNEIVSFEEFIDFIFLNAKYGIAFEHTVNHTLEHIIRSMWIDYPNYYEEKYIKHFWITQDEFMKCMAVGSDDEYDPKGIVRFYVKENFKKLVATKI